MIWDLIYKVLGHVSALFPFSFIVHTSYITTEVITQVMKKKFKMKKIAIYDCIKPAIMHLYTFIINATC